MLNRIMRQMKDSIGDNLLSLSGEVLITNKDTHKFLVYEGKDRKETKKALSLIANKYQFMKIEMVNGLNEVTIKFFVHKANITDKAFLDNFCNDLKILVSKILENEEFLVRVNFFGSFETTDKICSYRYLNKQQEVQYKIVDEDLKEPYMSILRPKFYLIIALIGLIAFSSWQGYRYYQEKQTNEAASVQTETIDEGRANSDKEKDSSVSESKGIEKTSFSPRILPVIVKGSKV